MADPGQTVIRGKSDLAPKDGITGDALTYTHAATAMLDAVMAHQELAEELQLVRVGAAA